MIGVWGFGPRPEDVDSGVRAAEHVRGSYSMMWFNYMQHVHCDPWSKYDHSRNITGRIFNFIVFNNGLHTVHHFNAATHWSELRTRAREDRRQDRSAAELPELLGLGFPRLHRDRVPAGARDAADRPRAVRSAAGSCARQKLVRRWQLRRSSTRSTRSTRVTTPRSRERERGGARARSWPARSTASRRRHRARSRRARSRDYVLRYGTELRRVGRDPRRRAPRRSPPRRARDEGRLRRARRRRLDGRSDRPRDRSRARRARDRLSRRVPAPLVRRAEAARRRAPRAAARARSAPGRCARSAIPATATRSRSPRGRPNTTSSSAPSTCSTARPSARFGAAASACSPSGCSRMRPGRRARIAPGRMLQNTRVATKR